MDTTRDQIRDNLEIARLIDGDPRCPGTGIAYSILKLDRRLTRLRNKLALDIARA